MRVKRDLLAGDWAVVALLCEEPRHGYALASLMAPDGEIGRVWSLRRPMTGAALEFVDEVLEGQGTMPGLQRNVAGL